MKKTIRQIFLAAVICCAAMLGIVLGTQEAGAQEAGAAGNSLVHIEPLKTYKVSDETFDVMAKDALKKGAVATDRKSFIKEFQKHAVKREKTFSIVYRGNVNNIPSKTIYTDLGEIDDKKTSDDADFLSGGILYMGWSGYYNSSNQIVLNCKLNYTENASQVKKDSQKSKAVLKKLKVSGMSDTAKVKVIHDYVVGLVTYDHSLRDHSAYGGLVASKHSTVCQGYALMMYKLLTDAGVTAHYVTGDAGGPHAWNIVKIKGKWYYIDATWDDPSNTLSYDYFLIGSKQMNKDHKLDSYYKKKYKIQSGNLDWQKLIKKSGKKQDKKVKTEQTTKEKKKTKLAEERAEVVHELNDALDEALKESPDAEEYEVQMYDLCKKIYGFIIEDMSDKAFKKFLDSDAMMQVYVDGTLELIDYYIIDPCVKYMDSEDFMNTVLQAIYKDFDESDFEGLSDEEMDGLVEAYAYEAFTDVLYDQSDAYTEKIVKTMVKTLEAMA